MINFAPKPLLAAEDSTGNTGKISFRVYLELSAIFITALLLRLAYNFCLPHPNAYSAADAAEYLRNAQALWQLSHLPASFWQDCLSCLLGTGSPQLHQAIKSAFQPLSDFAISGPVFPLFLLGSFSLAGFPFSISNWTIPLMAQSIITSVSCVLITLCGRLAWNHRTGLIAGVLAAAYPGFIVNSGRLYSESFACFLLTAVMWLTLRGFINRGNGPWASFFTGFTLAGLQLTRSIMFVVTLALVPITFLQQKDTGKRIISLALLAAGFAVIACPWLAWQKLAFGSGTLVVDRVGHYNFWTGNHVDTQGWLSFPYPDGRGIESRSFPQLWRESYQASPARWAKLMLDKPLRLFKFPWNDFRTPIGFLRMQDQVILHQLLLLFAALGISLALFLNPSNQPIQKGQLSSRLFLAGLLSFHFVYCLFITVPRYNLTAMPGVILLAAAGISNLLSLWQQSLKAASRITTAAALLFTVTHVDLLSALHELPGLSDIRLCLFIASSLKSISWLLFIITLWQQVKLFPPGNKVPQGLARGGILLLGLLAFSGVCLPLRAHGRCYEWSSLLNKTGQSITQSVVIPKGSLDKRQGFLLIDSQGASALESGLKVIANGIILNGPLIPGLSLAGAPHAYKTGKDNSLFLEGEYIFDCLSRPAGLSNRDLRQWFILPLPEAVLAKSRQSGKLVITLLKTESTPSRFYGAYAVSAKAIEIPSIDLYSWEKAFYGVENEAGLTDTRYDLKIARRPGNPPPPKGDYYMRLLTFPVLPSSPPNGTLLVQTLPGGKESNHLAITDLPAYAAKDLWLVRIRGKIRALNKQSTCRLQLRAVTQGPPKLTYDSPWTPGQITCKTSWTGIDVTVPLQTGSLPGRLQKIDLSLIPDSGSIENRDLTLEIVRLGANPIAPGHQVY